MCRPGIRRSFVWYSRAPYPRRVGHDHQGGQALSGCLVGYTRTPRWGDGGFAYASDAYAASAFDEAYGAVL